MKEVNLHLSSQAYACQTKIKKKLTLILTRLTLLQCQRLQSKQERTRGKNTDQAETTAAEAIVAVVANEVAVTVDNAVAIIREIGVIPMTVDGTLAGKEAIVEIIAGKETIVSVEIEAEA